MRAIVRMLHRRESLAARAWGWLVLAATAASVAGILWFMNRAVDNERLAVRQQLVEAYQAQLAGVAEQIEKSWEEKAAILQASRQDAAPAKAFFDLVSAGVCDSAVLRDDSGRVAYPELSPSQASVPEAKSDAWQEAESLEFAKNNPQEAVRRYETIALLSGIVPLKAQATVAWARCLAKCGRTSEAQKLLSERFAAPALRAARDSQGNLIALHAELAALHYASDADADSSAIQCLAARVCDYEGPSIPSAQRRFLLGELTAMAPDPSLARLLEAEQIAAQYLESGSLAPRKKGVAATALDGLWCLVSGDGRTVALLRQERVQTEAHSVVKALRLPAGTTLEFRPASRERATSLALVRVPVGPWELALTHAGKQVESRAAARRITALLWSGTLLALFASLVGIVTARQMSRHLRLARLKNDLTATVSHELKTPLASMRALTETLLEGNVSRPEQMREYLTMLASEILRLSRLVENFLAFSRMERQGSALRRERLDLEELVREALANFEERLRQEEFAVETEIAPDLSSIEGDRNALLTCLHNLLDNAIKYSPEQKQIAVRLSQEEQWVRVEISDRGIGIARSVQKRVFDSFYQADSRLSRRAGGCGLGLSIVSSIVRAHGGTVQVDSEPGRGSTFAVRLPNAPSGEKE